MRRRSFLLLGSAALLGCAAENRAPSISVRLPFGPTATPAHVHPGGPGTVTLALGADPGSLAAPPSTVGTADPRALAEQTAARLLFASLVGLDENGEPFPDLAESVPSLEAGGAQLVGEGDARQLEVTFRLRPNLRWSDGQPLTADDVVFSWRLALLPDEGVEVATERRYERVEARDPRTVVFTFYSERSARAAAAREPNRFGFLADQSGPVLDPLYSLGLPNSWVYPAHALPGQHRTRRELFAATGFDAKPVGAGPFVLKERAAGRVVLEPRREHHRGAPKLRGVVLRTAPAPGEADLFLGEPPLQPSGGPALRPLLARLPSTAVEQLTLNRERPALRDQNARTALARALDRRALRALALGEPGEPEGFESRYPPDPEAAGRLLAGAKPALKLVTTDGRSSLAEALRAQLARVGFAVDVERRADLFDPAGPLARRDFDLALHGSVGGVDPLSDLELRHRGQSRELDALLARAATTLERAPRRDLARQAAERVLEDLLAIPLFTYPRAVVATDDLRGVRLPTLGPVTWNAHEWALA